MSDVQTDPAPTRRKPGRKPTPFMALKLKLSPQDFLDLSAMSRRTGETRLSIIQRAVRGVLERDRRAPPKRRRVQPAELVSSFESDIPAEPPVPHVQPVARMPCVQCQGTRVRFNPTTGMSTRCAFCG